MDLGQKRHLIAAITWNRLSRFKDQETRQQKQTRRIQSKDADYSILRSVHLIKSTAQKKISYLIIRRKNNQLLINQ